MTGRFRLKRQGKRVIDMARHERHPRFVGAAQSSAQMLHEAVSGLCLVLDQFLLLSPRRLTSAHRQGFRPVMRAVEE